jgi:hypothetical protein
MLQYHFSKYFANEKNQLIEILVIYSVRTFFWLNRFHEILATSIYNTRILYEL